MTKIEFAVIQDQEMSEHFLSMLDNELTKEYSVGLCIWMAEQSGMIDSRRAEQLSAKYNVEYPFFD